MSTQKKRPGGRTEKTRRAVLSAAYEVLAEQGYDGFSVEAIADRSGIHKTTIYRRWRTADDVLFAAVVAQAQQAIPLEVTDDPEADLVAMGRAVARNLTDPMARAVAAAALSRTGADRLAQLTKRFWEERMAQASVIVVAAQEAGVIDPDLEPVDAVQRVVGPIWFRSIVLQDAVDDEFVESLVNALV